MRQVILKAKSSKPDHFYFWQKITQLLKHTAKGEIIVI